MITLYNRIPGILVCGTVYGSSYVRALCGPGRAFRLAGILGRNGASSRSVAQQLGLPYYTSAEQVSRRDVDAVCVAVGGANGRKLAETFLHAGLPVLQEHPLSLADTLALQAAAVQGRSVWHLNAHFGDLPAAGTLIAGSQRLAGARSPLYISATMNPRTSFSVLDILMRAVPEGEWGPWSRLPAADEAEDFLVSVRGSRARTMVTLNCQRSVSAADDGSATLVSHHIEIAYPDGVLELSDSFGPGLWRPNPASVGQIQNSGQPGPGMWGLMTSPHPLSPSQVQQQRDAANYRAIASLVQHAAGAAPPPHQVPEYQRALCQTWDAVVQALGPPQLITEQMGAT